MIDFRFIPPTYNSCIFKSNRNTLKCSLHITDNICLRINLLFIYFCMYMHKILALSIMEGAQVCFQPQDP